MRAQEAARLLGVPVDADRDAVERAFRVRAIHEHPDHGGDAARFALLQEARQVLRARGAVPPAAALRVRRPWGRRLLTKVTDTLPRRRRRRLE